MNRNKAILMLALFSLMLLNLAYQLHVWFDGNENALDIIVKVQCFQFVLVIIGFITSLKSIIADY